MCNKYYLLLLLIIISCVDITNSRGGRGGGSRGGGSRSSVRSSRSGSSVRSGSAGKIGISSRYSSWSRTHGFSASFRYRYASYRNKRTGIMTGLIIISPHQRSTFRIHEDRYYDDISICYNEFTLYDRNVSASPWFVCPWDNILHRYCCGDEIEEYCCAYFDRPSHLAALINGILIFLLVIGVTCYCCCKRSRKRQKGDLVVYMEANKIEQEEVPLAPIPGGDSYPISNPSDNSCPPYPLQPEMVGGYPPYEVPNETGLPYPQYPAGPPCPPCPPYPTYPLENPSAPMPQSDIPPQGQVYANEPMSYDGIGPQYPLTPPEAAPPSYLDAVKLQNVNK